MHVEDCNFPVLLYNRFSRNRPLIDTHSVSLKCCVIWTPTTLNKDEYVYLRPSIKENETSERFTSRGIIRNAYKILSENLKGRAHLGDGMIIFNWILKKYDIKI
jgi:hypothetical protein